MRTKRAKCLEQTLYIRLTALDMANKMLMILPFTVAVVRA